MERNNLFEIIPGLLLRALLPEHDGNYSFADLYGRTRKIHRLQAVLFKRTALEAVRIETKSLLNRAESGALHCGTYSLDARFCTRQFLFRSTPPISSSTCKSPLLYQPPPFLGGGRYSDCAHRLFHGAVVLSSSPVTL